MLFQQQNTKCLLKGTPVLLLTTPLQLALPILQARARRALKVDYKTKPKTTKPTHNQTKKSIDWDCTPFKEK